MYICQHYFIALLLSFGNKKKTQVLKPRAANTLVKRSEPVTSNELLQVQICRNLL